MNRATIAFFLTLIIYLLVLVSIFSLLHFIPQVHNEPKEKKIKIELKDYKKKVSKNSGEKRPQKKVPKFQDPVMPKGKQLKKIVKSFKKYTPEKVLKREPKKRVVKKEEPKILKTLGTKRESIPSSKPYIPLKKASLVEKKVEKKIENNSKHSELNVTKVEKKEKSLYSILSKKVISKKRNQKANSTNRESRINSDIRELYGDEFGKLSQGEQKYILDNQEVMRRITQQVLNRVGSVNIPSNLRVNRHNIVEFYLYPNGDISDIKFLERTGFYILDDTTKETIEYAYAQYPHPKQKTLIRYKVGYYLQGY